MGRSDDSTNDDEKRATPPRVSSNVLGAAGLVVVLVVLVVLVVWSLPKSAGTIVEAGDGGAAPTVVEAPRPPPRATGQLPRPPQASCEIGVLTDKPADEVAKVANVEAIAARLDIRHCGPACDEVRKFLADKDRFEVEVTTSEDWILPPKDTIDAIAPGLTAKERASVHQRPTVVVVRAHGPPSIAQLPARAGFAAAAVVAEALDGLVYDETVRRIETASAFTAHTIRVPIGEPVFLPKQIVVQLYRQDDGTARLLTLGMVRFGTADFTARGATMASGTSIANVVNAVAGLAAATRVSLPFVVSLDDVARASGHLQKDLAKDPAASRPVNIEAERSERVDGDPDNDMVELLPREGSNVAGWNEVLRELFGEMPRVVVASSDKELLEIAVRARRDLPAALRRFGAAEGTLFVKGPFSASRDADGGSNVEWMWIEVTSCDTKMCTGLLSNSPTYATNLTAGTTTTVPRSQIADWLLKLKDGSIEGGESMRALQNRAP